MHLEKGWIMRPNKLKQMWKEGEATAVAWLGSADPYMTEILAHSGFDALVLDMQHGMGIGPDTAAQWLQVVSTTDTVPLVRVPWNEPVFFQWVLDAGAYGVIVPLVNNAEEAAKAGMSSKYPPIGFRSIGPNRVNLYAGGDYFEHANDETVCLVMVEHKDTIPHLDAMAEAPGVDGFYIGPADLAISMTGTPSNYRDIEEHNKASQKVVDVAKAHGLVAGTHCGGPEEAADRFRQGFQLCPIASDGGIMAAGARDAVEAIRKGAGGVELAY